MAQKVTDRALAGLPNDRRFDTLIIDEAQDFEADWFETARLFVGDDDPILWLEDPNQNVRGTDTLSLQDHGFVGYRSMVNYRSPERIARFIHQVLPEFAFTCGGDQALAELEKRLGRPLRPRKRGRPAFSKNDCRQLKLV